MVIFLSNRKAEQLETKKFKRVLIANRGEIAVRIIRCLRELGIQSVAIYSDADSMSKHRFMADFAVRLPGRLSSETYLRMDLIAEAVRESGADAVHPGFGFLSESPAFVRYLESETSATFIGPSASAMEKMGDKIAARRLMKQAGVSIVPGSMDPLKEFEEVRGLVAEIGYPVILKAAAGGGGRGMRIVENESTLKSSLEACQREALQYFGNPDVFCERFIRKGRHIEFQVIADQHGNAVHLFERDCSLQRKHQKVIEEAPSQYLSEESRQKMGEMAVAAARAVQYSGAGTIEYICESPNQFYFMEMNTRIQVEHPVTEMITGIDLIAEQIRVAEGHTLSVRQQDIKIYGHAIECRVNAEDPFQGFMPSPGLLETVEWPAGPFTRVDTHTYAGYEIPKEYDSMIAKVLTWGKNREDARQRARRALSELRITGIRTNCGFLQRLLDSDAFVHSTMSTRFIDENMEELISSQSEELLESTPELIAAIAYEARLFEEGRSYQKFRQALEVKAKGDGSSSDPGYK